jgi:2-polyprenyl-6-hydroxyphenyl methylase/3-demethylubiquinone-9 3-methyltransferase
VVVATLSRAVNNAIYDTLGARWYDAKDDPVALLRAESRHRNPWVSRRIEELVGKPVSVLDMGCGAGFLSNHLADLGHVVTGVDQAPDSLAVAARHDRTRSVDYRAGDVYSLPFADGRFDVVCAMDLLEHLEDPERAVAEAARLLAPSGLFFFHTFSRTFLAWLVVIKGVEWFVKNTPPDMHVLRLFVRPDELAAMGRRHGLEPLEMHGSRPRLGAPFWKMLATGVVSDDFEFKFVRSTRLGYTGVAQKLAPHPRTEAPRPINGSGRAG